LRIHIPEIEIDCDVVVINKKFRQFITIIENNSEITFTNIHTNSVVNIKMFQKIRIKLVLTRKSLNKINIVVIDPDFKFLLSGAV
jgi:hypothetical protein